MHPVGCLLRAERLFSLAAVPSSVCRALGTSDPCSGIADSDHCVGRVHGRATAYGCDCMSPQLRGKVVFFRD